MPKQTKKKSKGSKKKVSKGGRGKNRQGPCWNGYHRNSKPKYTKGSCVKN
tara:strand:+ start:819 stop:968 length:150 start_codon:yes stop_codon:yes gene_type:complete